MMLQITPSCVMGTVAVPGSKSHTIRAIAGALLANGKSIVRAPLHSDDTYSTLQAAIELGATVEKFADRWEITGCGGNLRTPEKILDMGNSGTGLRMLTAIAALAEGKVAFTGDVFINLTDLTKKQAEYNQYAPILMTSVDTDAKLCSKERSAFLQRLGVGRWSIFGGHGAKKEYVPQTNK